MEETIYYKSAPENVPDVKSLLLDYLLKGSPATFSSTNNESQCMAGCNRSIDDLLMLSNHYFPGTSIKEMLLALCEVKREVNVMDKTIIVFVCGDIHKPVVHGRLLDGLSLYDHARHKEIFYKPHLEYNTTKSQWPNMKTLAEMI